MKGQVGVFAIHFDPGGKHKEFVPFPICLLCHFYLRVMRRCFNADAAKRGPILVLLEGSHQTYYGFGAHHSLDLIILFFVLW